MTPFQAGFFIKCASEGLSEQESLGLWMKLAYGGGAVAPSPLTSPGMPPVSGAVGTGLGKGVPSGPGGTATPAKAEADAAPPATQIQAPPPLGAMPPR